MIAVVLLGSLLTPAPLEGPEVDWHAPPECPGQTELLADVAEILGRPLARDGRLRVEGRVEPIAESSQHGSARWRLDLRLASESGEQRRTLDAERCDELVDVAATLIAIAAAPPEPEPSPEPEPEPTPEPEPSPEPEPTPEPRPTTPTERSPWRGFVAAAAGLGLGPLPGPAPVVTGGVGLFRGRARLEAEVDYWLVRSVFSDQDSDAGGQIQLWAVTLRGCFAPRVAALEFPICGGAQAGQLLGRGVGVAEPRSSRMAWLSAELGAGVRVPVHPNVALRGDVALLVPVLRPGFEIEALGELHRAFPVGFSGGLGLEFRFP